MRSTSRHRTMPFRNAALTLLCALAVGGCVSANTHRQTLDELNALKKQSAQQQEQLTGMRESLDLEAAQRKAAEGQAASLANERDDLNVRSEQLAGELATVRSQITDLEQKRASDSASAQEEIVKLQQQAASMETEAAQLAKEREQLRQERVAKEAEIKRLTRTQEELSKSLQDEISKGNITIQQVRDRLTINMVDRVLFDSGQAEVKPAGQKVLKPVSDLLKTVTDKQIRIEGHTDNVPISVKLQSRYKTNWELSTARATAVVRYLIDQGGIDPRHLSAVGYADTQPVASNDTDEGRSANRRIEIVLYPKDLKEIADQAESSTVVSP